MRQITAEELHRIIKEKKPVFTASDDTKPNDEKPDIILEYYQLLTQYPELISQSIPELSRADLFYNRYYWFMKFKNISKRVHGYDAGIEQMAFQLLEEIEQGLEEGVDWAIIEQLEKEAIQE